MSPGCFVSLVPRPGSYRVMSPGCFVSLIPRPGSYRVMSPGCFISLVPKPGYFVTASMCTAGCSSALPVVVDSTTMSIVL